MSASYQAVGWNRQKKIYDWILFGFCVCYLIVFSGITLVANPDVTFETLLIRSSSTLAVLLLTIILSIGPLCRLNPKFLPLLYNRRHLGVTMFCIALVHGAFGILQFHTLGNTGPLNSLFTSNTNYGSFADFPFQALGFFALIIFALMAITSHDFWLHNLSPRIWKTLHMFVYLAYFLIVMHVMLGVIQYETNPVFVLILLLGSFTIITLHLVAGIREFKKDHVEFGLEKEGFVKVCGLGDIGENRAKIFCPDTERIAIFKTEGKLFAVHNVCKHQNGPLGEGRIVDGCITCPWHGYQYLPKNGQSPLPFREKVSTYDVKLNGTEVWLNPNPFPEGTERPGVAIQMPSGIPEESSPLYIGWMAVAPNMLAQFIKKYLLFIFLLAIVLGSLLTLSQKKFGTGNFEFGTLTDVKGIYFDKPVPCIKVLNGKDIWGNTSYLTIPLVGYGKHGAEGAIRELEKEKNTTLNQKELTLRGTLLYNDGVTILQVDKNDNDSLIISNKNVPAEWLPGVKDLGLTKIKGEIIDPKCYFGVMKPGEGKPHRDCAVRCILGGIPPMFAVKNEKGEANYYLLASYDGGNINLAVKDYVAEPVELEAHLMQYDDWVVAYIRTKDPIKRYSYLQEHFGSSQISCAANR